MDPLTYYGISMLAGVITSLTCALRKMINTDPEHASDYPNSDPVDNEITTKRIIWLFAWIMQGVIGGLVVAFIFSSQVFEGSVSPSIAWALAFIAGSVAWINFKESFSAIKKIVGFFK